MTDDPIIPEFRMYAEDLFPKEIEELAARVATEGRSNKDQFLLFTDILMEYVGAGQWKNRSAPFLAMCAKACFLRGAYGYNQILARGTSCLACKGYAAAAYCRQSLDPRWLNNLRNITNQTWQSKDYVVFSELSGQLAAILIDLGYTDHAADVASDSIEKVTKATAKNQEVRSRVQAALLNARIIQAFIAGFTVSREEALIRLNSAEDTAKHLGQNLALADIKSYRARVLIELGEYERAVAILTPALRAYEQMGYLQGVAYARNLRGVIFLDLGQLQEARDQFEELLIIQQQLNDQIGLAKSLINVGEIDRTLGQIDQMETYNRRALEISQEAEYVRGTTTATANLGDVELRKGNVQAASEYYQRSIDLAESAGMKKLLTITLFLAGDAGHLTCDYGKALQYYHRVREIATEIDYPLLVFNAEVSELVTRWAMAEESPPALKNRIISILGDPKELQRSTDPSVMKGIRKRIFDDESVESELCIFFDGEKNFECRVERKSLRKECFGNLYWMGSLCPYFRDFLAKLDT
ncbi:MAG: tetratricopeptide repeat protein [Candidatus Thorarchaeota archaeon]|nr:tetratricopeptide repeat protein [Candidatus Thorarchaeota archaeon]